MARSSRGRHGELSLDFGAEIESDIEILIATLPREHRERASQEVHSISLPRADIGRLRHKVHDVSYERQSCKDVVRLSIIDVVVKVLGIHIEAMERMYAERERGKKRDVPVVNTNYDVVGLLWMSCMNWAKEGWFEDLEPMREVMKRIDEDIENAMMLYRRLLVHIKDERVFGEGRESVVEKSKEVLFRIKRAREVKREWGLDVSRLEEDHEKEKSGEEKEKREREEFIVEMNMLHMFRGDREEKRPSEAYEG